MAKFYGIALIVVGVIMLVVSYLSSILVDYNWYQMIALLFIIGGVVAHIITLRKQK